MQAEVGTLLLITSVVMLSCLVIGFAASISIQVVENPQVLWGDHMGNLTDSIHRQSQELFNQTQSPAIFDASPTP
jgi:hypothetical protein